MAPTPVLTCAASQLEGTSNNANNIHAFLISSRLLEVFFLPAPHAPTTSRKLLPDLMSLCEWQKVLPALSFGGVQLL
jgi:hypothetical protein